MDPHAGWVWDMDRVRSMTITDNVVKLLTEHIANLDPRVQDVLKQSACIGVQFDLDTLSNITNLDLDKLLFA